jgi:signal transduction histidine kinase
VIGRSLRWRLLLGAAIAILAALVVAWGFMAWLFERHLDRRLEAEMTRDALVLVAALSLAPDAAPQLDATPVDVRLQTPASGFYWQVRSDAGVLRSRSLWDADLDRARPLPRNGWRLRRADGPFDEAVAILEREILLGDGAEALAVQLAQDTGPLRRARDEFARELALFLALLWGVLAAAAWVQVSLGLRPLRRVRGDLDALRANAKARLPTATLSEIQPLTTAINALADAREEEITRARRRAADLAHGLKTPLAALAAQSRRAREAGAEAAAIGMEHALAALGATVEAELSRAHVAPGGAAPVRRTLEALIDVIEHTDAGARISFDVDIDDERTIPVSPEAWSEIAGALLENAARHARRRVRIGGEPSSDGLAILIEDDGPGIARDRRDEVLTRGARLDESGGQGRGLAIARDLVIATGGELTLGESALGGLAVRIAWPLSPSATRA